MSSNPSLRFFVRLQSKGRSKSWADTSSNLSPRFFVRLQSKGRSKSWLFSTSPSQTFYSGMIIAHSASCRLHAPVTTASQLFAQSKSSSHPQRIVVSLLRALFNKHLQKFRSRFGCKCRITCCCEPLRFKMFLATFSAYLNSLRALSQGRSIEDAEAALVESLKALKEANSSGGLTSVPSEGEAASQSTSCTHG